MTDYLIKTKQCESALEELAEYKNQILAKGIYTYWLAKHIYLYHSLEPYYLHCHKHVTLDKFHELYYELKRFEECLPFVQLAKVAVSEYTPSLLLSENESKLLEWLVRFEELKGNASGLFVWDVKYRETKTNSSFPVKGFEIDSSDYNNLILFWHLFEKSYCKMFDKYNTYTEEEMVGITCGNDQEAQKTFSCLAYHLKKRGVIL